MLVESDPMRGGPYRLPGPGALLDRYRLPDLPTVPGSGRPAVRGGLTSRAPPYLGSPSPAAQANSPLTLSLLEDRGALDHAEITTRTQLGFRRPTGRQGAPSGNKRRTDQ